MLRRLHEQQPETFAFTAANAKWADGQIAKYPDGRQASAIIPLLWRAQEQEGWLSKPAIERVADLLDMPYIRALEVATFYFMFQLRPVGTVAHIQVCGTTSCMICGAEDLISVCKEKIGPNAHEVYQDGQFSWEEVECLGACANAPMVQIGKDYYEDLTAEKFGTILDALARGEVPTAGPQNGRYASEPASGLTSLQDFRMPEMTANASAARATQLGDTIARITGDEADFVPIKTSVKPTSRPAKAKKTAAKPAAKASPESASKPAAAPKPETKAKAAPKPKAAPKAAAAAAPKKDAGAGTKPTALKGARGGKADDLKRIKGIGPKLEKLCNSLGFFHFDQIAAWSADEVAWVDDNLEGFKGRVTRDEWVAQAGVLAKSG